MFQIIKLITISEPLLRGVCDQHHFSHWKLNGAWILGSFGKCVAYLCKNGVEYLTYINALLKFAFSVSNFGGFPELSEFFLCKSCECVCVATPLIRVDTMQNKTKCQQLWQFRVGVKIRHCHIYISKSLRSHMFALSDRQQPHIMWITLSCNAHQSIFIFSPARK